jgi:hypothetical protein
LLQLTSKNFKIIERATEELAPPEGSLPLPRWARGPLLVPCRLGTPTCKIQVNIWSEAFIHVLPRSLQHWTLPSSKGWLRGCHMSRGFESCLPNRKASGATACTVAPNPASLQGRAPMCHVYRGSGPHLPAMEDSGAPRVLQLRILPPYRGGLRCFTCPTTPDSTSLHGRASVLHVSYTSRSCFPVGEGSGAPRAL